MYGRLSQGGQILWGPEGASEGVVTRKEMRQRRLHPASPRASASTPLQYWHKIPRVNTASKLELTRKKMCVSFHVNEILECEL